MEPSVLLIVTNKADPHADEVIRILSTRRIVRPVRVNTDDYFSNCYYAYRWEADGQPIKSNLSILDSGLSIENVDVAWWRKPSPLQPPPDLSHPEAIRVALEEGEAFLRCLDAPFLNLTWVSHPDLMRAASRKLQQFNVARAFGLSVPETVVTNRSQEVAEFIREYGRCIIKPIAAGAFIYGGKSWGIFTSRITLDEIEAGMTSVEYAPVMIQRELEKHLELRITIIGDSVFSCAIDTRGIEHSDVRTDWRVIEPESLPHSLVSIPDSLSNALKGMLKHYNLNYGAFDVIQESDGRYYFLELNPNGQYLWIELITGAPMSEAMASLIEKLATESMVS